MASRNVRSDDTRRKHVRPLPSIDALVERRTPSILPDDEDQVRAPHNWTDKPLVGSPPQDGKHVFRAASPGWEQRLKAQKPAPLTLGRPGTPDSLLTSPRARWEQLRQHVLPVSIRPASPPVQSPQPSPALTQTFPPPRAPTPRPFRFGRLGLRHVVDQAREVATDDARRFANEIQRLCWATRLTDPHNKGKQPEREPTTIGSSIHLPFMSTTSLHALNSLNNDTSLQKKHELPRPQSRQSLVAANRPATSLRPLHQTILQYATGSSDGTRQFAFLPHESQVLSTLLTPFLSIEKTVPLNDERWLATEAFEWITRAWRPSDETTAVERVLWCCVAATTPSPNLRTRVLSLLWGLLIPHETNYQATTPDSFRGIVYGLITLLSTLRRQPLPSGSTVDNEDFLLTKDIAQSVRSGCCGDLDSNSVQEHYTSALSNGDEPALVRQAIFLEAFSSCCEQSDTVSRLWLLQHALEDVWFIPSISTPLLNTVFSRIIKNLSGALAVLISMPSDQSQMQMELVAVSSIAEKLIPAVAFVNDTVPDVAKSVARVVVLLLCLSQTKETVEWSAPLITSWCREKSFWKDGLDAALRDIVSKTKWVDLAKQLLHISRLPDDAQKTCSIVILPAIHDKLVDDPPPYPCPPLTELLGIFSRQHPQIFYKVLFSCAASSKEFVVVNHLCTLIMISKFLPTFWIHDAEMMSVALMSEISSQKAATGLPKSNSRLGQCVLLLELINFIQEVRRVKEQPQDDGFLGGVIKFCSALEIRLGILLGAREQSSSTPQLQKVLLCTLFREIRLLSRSFKPTPWISQVMSWFVSYHEEDEISQEDFDALEQSSVSQIRGLYAAAQDGARPSGQRRSTLLLAMTRSQPSAEPFAESGSILQTMLGHRLKLADSLGKGFVAKAMKLLVTISALLTSDDYRRLAVYAWNHITPGNYSSLTTSACFLVMQCAEKTPRDLLAVMEVDLQSSDIETKIEALQKFGTLSNWRFQILAQPIIADRGRRPFKLTRGPLPFVATDIGSADYVLEGESSDMNSSNLPLELRKRLAEIGWDEQSNNLNPDQERARTPMSLLPAYQLNRQDHTSNAPQLDSPLSASPSSPTVEAGLLRRNSSSGGPAHNAKRRAIFVPSLSLLFPRIASLTLDVNPTVAHVARSIILDLMRNDPALLVRPTLDLLYGDAKDLDSAASTINAFLHVQTALPFSVTHFLFNHLTGFLKHSARHATEDDALQDFAHITPILARLGHQVSGMSMREIRRAKVEAFLIPSGSLWFPSSAPTGPMFPRNLDYKKYPFHDIPAQLISMTIIRISQNMLLISMLQKNPQEVQLIRKNMARLVLPTASYTEHANLELTDFIPSKAGSATPSNGISILSLMLSRSYLLLVAQIFRSMSRHLNDRNELAILVDGLNRILLHHGDDIGIVSQVMIALMVASTRFRRLFTAGGGYTLFMPAVMKVYAEYEAHTGIRLAIEYAVNRFYALHKEVFAFQTLDIIAHLITMPNVDSAWFAKSVYNLFSALRRGILPSTPDPGGIHNANKLQEREALMVSTVEERPQAFLSLLRRNEFPGTNQVTIDLPEQYESSRLGIDDVVRLFLTVIAHDPSILRAEQFLKLLRHLTPYIYHASSTARNTLQDGIDALGMVLLRASSKPRTPDPFLQSLHEGSGLPAGALLDTQLPEKGRLPSDISSMRLDYLGLIIAIVSAGGEISHSTLRSAMDMARLSLKDPPPEVVAAVSSFFDDLIAKSIIRESPPTLKKVVGMLREFVSLMNTHSSVLDLSGPFKTIASLASNPVYANEAQFCDVVHKICAEALVISDSLLSVPSYSSSLLALIRNAIFLRRGDVLSLLEKRPPSSDFLGCIVIPFAMSLKTEAVLISEGSQVESWHRKVLSNTWVRLLSFSMTCCQSGTQPKRAFSRSGSQNKKRSRRSHLKTAIMGFQLLKIVIICGHEDISSRFPAVWPRIAMSVKILLADGNAYFATQPYAISPLPSPTPSPRTSGQFDQFPTLPTFNTMMSQSVAVGNPRIVDYLLWSVLELLCTHRNPLVLQLRLFMQEKVVEVDQDLQSNINLRSSRNSVSHRLSGAMFSKPRKRMTGMPSPSSSPRLGPSLSSPQSSPSYGFDGRQAGYNSLESPQHNHGTKIVHLGPVPIDTAFGRPSLDAQRGMKSTTNTKIQSLDLARVTYRRIRTVQSHIGYSNLLPLPHSQEAEEDLFSRLWTKQSALHDIHEETKQLFDEFEHWDRDAEDDGVIALD